MLKALQGLESLLKFIRFFEVSKVWRSFEKLLQPSLKPRKGFKRLKRLSLQSQRIEFRYTGGNFLKSKVEARMGISYLVSYMFPSTKPFERLNQKWTKTYNSSKTPSRSHQELKNPTSSIDGFTSIFTNVIYCITCTLCKNSICEKQGENLQTASAISSWCWKKWQTRSRTTLWFNEMQMMRFNRVNWDLEPHCHYPLSNHPPER